ncbi:hypothetical protein, partial [Escherichia coli]
LAPVRAGNGKSEKTDLHHTAIGYLLQKGEEGDADTLATALTELSQALLSKVAGVAEPRQAWRMLLAHLAHSITTPKVEPLEEGGVIALVGPAG